jgi:hypothetical protein
MQCRDSWADGRRSSLGSRTLLRVCWAAAVRTSCLLLRAWVAGTKIHGQPGHSELINHRQMPHTRHVLTARDHSPHRHEALTSIHHRQPSSAVADRWLFPITSPHTRNQHDTSCRQSVYEKRHQQGLDMMLSRHHLLLPANPPAIWTATALASGVGDFLGFDVSPSLNPKLLQFFFLSHASL